MQFTPTTRRVPSFALSALAGLLGLAGVATRADAQCGNQGDVAQNCLPQTNITAIEHKHFSRTVNGEAFIGPETAVRLRQCGPNTKTRVVSKLPIVLNLCQEKPCDELTLPAPCFVPRGYILDGLYNSQTRMNDPCANGGATGVPLQNPRLGVFSAGGDVRNCAGQTVGKWTVEGTIGPNDEIVSAVGTDCGACYECDHHKGLLKITGLKDSGKFCPPSNIVAFLEFDTNKANCPVPGPTCDTLDPCEVAFIVHDGTADGIYRKPCCHAVIDPTGGGHGHNNPNAAAGDDDTGPIEEIEIIQLP